MLHGSHCGAVDARFGHQRRRSWQTCHHHEPGHVSALPTLSCIFNALPGNGRQGEPPVQGGSAKQAVGFRLYLCAHMVGDSLRGVCHRRLCKADRRLANLDIHEDTVCAPLSADCFAIACRATDALEQAIWQRKTQDNKDLVHHSDSPSHGLKTNRCRATGSQYLSIKYTERLAEAEIDLSVGTVGDAYDNALAECVIGLFKTEVLLSDSSNRLPGNASTRLVHGNRCAKSNGKR